MDEEHWIYLDETKKEGVSVTLFDAYHCPGAIMYLFKGKMGSVLHTGDFRFCDQVFNNPLLYPPEKKNPVMRAISVDVDYLFLDNTFANPDYDFPSRDEAYQSLVNIVKNHREYRIFIFSYNLGKEEVFLNLAEEFETLVSSININFKNNP
jgi:DNA cross-link repair 1B protein